jgi:hypothetical protein
MVVGIVTAVDLGEQFQILSEPFLLLSEIEGFLRNIINECFESHEMHSIVKNRRKSPDDIDADDLSFGDYLTLFQEPTRWKKTKLRLDRATFCHSLDRIRELRNNVAHFLPEGITREDLDEIRAFAKFLKDVVRLRAC